METPDRHSWDIFCSVVDNFGDIGVTWRLARQLHRQYGQVVRLWVDDLRTLTKLLPDVTSTPQCRDGVTICHWTATAIDKIAIADVVIEAFACELPTWYSQAMATRSPPPVWINLEYLSAENWVEEYHGISSPHPQLGISKICYFPGFTERTGGLIAEHGLLQKVQGWQAHHPDDPASLSISLFTYDNPVISKLLALWRKNQRHVICRVPEGSIVHTIEAELGCRLALGRAVTLDNLTIELLPFTDQADYDTLLWASQLNFVRGEDSFVRAQWACRPFIWHIYPQEHQAHFIKLNAFLRHYCRTLTANAAAAVMAVHHAWNGQHAIETAWHALEAHLAELATHAHRWPKTLQQQGDLGYRLVKLVKSRLQ